MAFEFKSVIFYPDPEPALDLDVGGGRDGSGGKLPPSVSSNIDNVIWLDDYRQNR